MGGRSAWRKVPFWDSVEDYFILAQQDPGMQGVGAFQTRLNGQKGGLFVPVGVKSGGVGWWSHGFPGFQNPHENSFQVPAFRYLKLKRVVWASTSGFQNLDSSAGSPGRPSNAFQKLRFPNEACAGTTDQNPSFLHHLEGKAVHVEITA